MQTVKMRRDTIDLSLLMFWAI